MAGLDLGTAEGRAQALLLLDPDFHGLLQRKEVAEGQQAALAVAGVRSISRFNAMADSRQGLRTFCTGTLGLDAGRDAVAIASVLDAWEAAKVRMEVRNKAEAEAVSANLPATLNKVEYQDIRRRFESLHYALEDRTTPSAATLELICDQIESGELKTLHLIQCLSQEDAEIDPVGAVIDKSGTLKIKKGYGETTEPRDPEEYRRRMKVVTHTYLFAQIKYPHKAVLTGLTPHSFQKFVDYILGEHVMGLQAKDSEGLVVSKPTFKSVLHYEHQVRKEMVRLGNEGIQLQEALERARKDTVIKERHFITPTSLAALVVAQDKRSDRSRSPKRGDTWRGSWNQWHGRKDSTVTKEKAAERKAVARKEDCITRRQMGVRFAGSGIHSMKGVVSIAAESISARFVWEATPCMPAQRARTVLGRTPLEKARSDRECSRLEPHGRCRQKWQGQRIQRVFEFSISFQERTDRRRLQTT